MDYTNVLLHVGAGRTGTTTVQNFLAVNRQRLLQAGYSEFGPSDLESYPQDERFSVDSQLDLGLQEIGRKCSEAATPNVIWSRESLSNYDMVADPARLWTIKKQLPAENWRVIIYLRRQDHWVRSAYMQWGLKHKIYAGKTLPFAEWFERLLADRLPTLRAANLDYYAMVKPWIDVFGAENVTVRVFEKSQFLDGDLLKDFCRFAQMPEIDYDFAVANKNVSYNVPLHQMLGMYNSAFEEPCFNGMMEGYLADLATDEFFSRPFFPRFAIPPRTALAILNGCDESNRRVAREFLGRDDAILFREPWPAADDPYEPPAELTLETLSPHIDADVAETSTLDRLSARPADAERGNGAEADGRTGRSKQEPVA